MIGTQFHPEKSQRLGLAADREFFEVDSRDPVSRHRPEGRPCRAPGAGRHGARDCFPSRSGCAGARLRAARLRISAHRRSRRRLCRQADECRGGRSHSRNGEHSGAARRRRARYGDGRRLAGEGRRTRHHRHCRSARSSLCQTGGARLSRPRRGRPRRARRQSRGRRAGRKPRNCRRSKSPGASRMPAWRRSSTPTSRATACCKASISTPPLRLPTRFPFR